MTTTTKEIITLFVGQCGVQISSAVWELLSVEHDILPNGRKSTEVVDDISFQSFFQETMSGQYVPRTLMVDLEPTCIDEVKTGTYRKLFHPDQLLNAKEDAANNFARGHYTIGKDLYDRTMNNIRKLVDQCNNVSTMIIHSAYGGGTGSGFGTGIITRLASEYQKKMKMQISIIPSQQLSPAVVEPYNSILSVSAPLQNIDVALMFDNGALYNIGTKQIGMAHPTYCNINRLLAQVLSCLTVCERFEGCLQMQLDQFQTNLVPFPRIHFPIANYCPIVDRNRAEHQPLTAMDLSRSVFDKDSQLAMCNLHEGKFMSVAMIYRGNVTPAQINGAINEIKKNRSMEFVDWCPTGFKIGCNAQPVITIPSSGLAPTPCSVAMFTNNTAIMGIIERLSRKFDLLYSRKAFVYWYVGEGMEEGELMEARDCVASIEKDYDEISRPVGASKEHKADAHAYTPKAHASGNESTPQIVESSDLDGLAKPVSSDTKSAKSKTTDAKKGGELAIKQRRASGGSKRSKRSKRK